jgi:hypothetical protein
MKVNWCARIWNTYIYQTIWLSSEGGGLCMWAMRFFGFSCLIMSLYYFMFLFQGERVCVRCETQALRKNLGYRCAGHGVEDRATRWTALSAPHCHGKWIRLDAVSSVHDASCPTCKKGPDYIFVWNKDINYTICSPRVSLIGKRNGMDEWDQKKDFKNK